MAGQTQGTEWGPFPFLPLLHSHPSDTTSLIVYPPPLPTCHPFHVLPLPKTPVSK